MVLKIITSIVFMLYFIKCSIYLLTLFQQNHYDKIKFLKNLKSYYLNKVYQFHYYLGFIFLILQLFVKDIYIITLILLISSFVYINHYVIKLRITKRIIRLLVTVYLLFLLIIIISFKINLIVYSSILLLPFIIVLANLINMPIENMINKYFVKKAVKKLDNIKPIKCAITGSFGKTSTKNIVKSLICDTYNTYATPYSYNTLMGLSKSINNDLTSSLEIFIMEMGAFVSGEIEEMAKKFRPEIALITEVGMQHMSTFKSIENILDAKFEISKYLTEDDYLILNYENTYIRNYDLSRIKTNNIYTYGINYGKYLAKDIVFDKNVTTFSIYKENELLITLKMKLLGRHNVLNVLSGFVMLEVLKEKGINIAKDKIKKVVYNMMPSPHRLEYKENNNFYIYDDSYSSNVVGFKNACEVIYSQSGVKVIITPGIVDGGQFDKELNQTIASYITTAFDEVCLIENKSTLYIEQILKEKDIKYQKFSSFKMAYSYITNKYNNTKEIINILIENDLPDCYLER